MKLIVVMGLMALGLVSSAHAAGGLICHDPNDLPKAISEVAPIIERPDQPSDAEDMSAIYHKYHCVAIGDIPNGLVGMLLGHKPAAPEKEHATDETPSPPVKDTI